MNWFTYGCIPFRLSLVHLLPRLQYGQALAAGIGLAFLFIHHFGLRKTAFESSAKDKVVWWDAYRPFHALMFLAFAATGNMLFLFADAMSGIYIARNRMQPH